MERWKKLIAITAVLSVVMALLMMVFAAQVEEETAGEPGKKLTIVASLFPQYDFARIVAGERAVVKLLLPAGVESHTFDPKPSDIASIYKADLFIYTGPDMEPWAERVIAGTTGEGGPEIVNASLGIELIETENIHGHDEGHEHGYDPHIWLDPTLAMKMVDNISDALCRIDSEGEEFYRANGAAYKEQLALLDEDIFKVVKSAKRNILAFGGRFAYMHFLDRYGLRYVTAYQSCSAEAEPSVRDVARVVDEMRRNGLPCVFHEEFADPRIARGIAEQTGASIQLFSTAHNVGRDDLQRGTTFIDIMRDNLTRIEKGLN